MNISKIAVVGSGAWGTAIATIAARKADRVVLWSRNATVIDNINSTHINDTYLPDIKLDHKIIATNNIQDLASANLILVAVPAQSFREACLQLQPILTPNIPLIICCKGIEENTNLLMSEISPRMSLAVLSGPNFAHEVAQNKPAATTIAASDINLANQLANNLSNLNFRIYPSDDMIGVQICGAVKNVLAIACGIVLGKNLGENAKAALITRGVFEIGKLIEAKQGNTQTLLGLAGIGDIMLTCNSTASRNTSLGVSVAQGKKLTDILSERITIAEGAVSVKSVVKLAQQLNTRMPICQAVNDILYNNYDIDQVIAELLSRPIIND